MRIVLPMLALALVLSVQAGAQLSTEASPNPAPQGTPIMVNVSASIPAELILACPLDVRAGSPNGPVVWTVGPCIFLRVVIGPGSSYPNMGWNGKDSNNKNVAPGVYYLQTQWKPLNSTQAWMPHFIPVRVDPVSGPTYPLLTTTSAAKRGAALGLKVESPNQPNTSYLTAASFTTNVGLALAPSLHLALDQDWLFWLSIATPLGPIFNNFVGNLDAFGNATPGVNIPNLPALQGYQIAIQTAVVDKFGITLTNPITRVIG